MVSSSCLTRLVFFVFVSLMCGRCLGIISLCSIGGKTFQNVTKVPARERSSASVSFCVQSSSEIYRYVSIPLPTPNVYYWYPNDSQNKIIVQSDKNKTNKIINITINDVNQDDFTTVFKVGVYYNNDQSKPALQLWFKLIKENMIWLCDNRTFDFKQEIIIEGTINNSVTFNFCTETNGEFNTEETSLHRYYGNRSCKIQSKDNGTLQVYSKQNTTKSKLVVTITVNEVPENDFDYLFLVTVYTKDKSHKPLWIKLKQRASTSPEQQSTTGVSGNFNMVSTTMPVKSTTKFKSWQLTTKTTTVFSTATDAAHSCPSQTNSGCPNKWYPVYNQSCLIVMDRMTNVFADKHCARFGALRVSKNDTVNLRSCLLYQMQNSTIKSVRTDKKETVTLQADNYKDDYMVACLADRSVFAPPRITKFSIAAKNNEIVIQSQDLLNGNVPYVEFPLTEGLVTVTCEAYSRLDYNVTLTQDSTTIDEAIRNSNINYVIKKPSCNDSGIYICKSSNIIDSTQVQKEIMFKSPKITFDLTIVNNFGNTRIHTGDDVFLTCSAIGCPPPISLTLINDANIEMTEYNTNTVEHKITNVTCQHMTSYHCSSEDDDVKDSKAVLVIEKCPVQMCHNQSNSIKIFEQPTTNPTAFSVCLISSTMPIWMNNDSIKNITVSFEKRKDSLIYFTALISITSLETNLNTLRFVNDYGTMDYQIFYQPNESQHSYKSSNDPATSLDQSTITIIVLSVALVVVIVGAVIVFLVYRHKGRGAVNTPSELVNYDNFNSLQLNANFDFAENEVVQPSLNEYEKIQYTSLTSDYLEPINVHTSLSNTTLVEGRPYSGYVDLVDDLTQTSCT